jgi:WhiB family redox-sensing transcriptional regulator
LRAVDPGRLALPVLPGASCKGQDPRLWFPGTGQSPEEAKAVCRACPARVRCREWAVQADERTGVWGATTPDERDQIRGQRRPDGVRP